MASPRVWQGAYEARAEGRSMFHSNPNSEMDSLKALLSRMAGLMFRDGTNDREVEWNEYSEAKALLILYNRGGLVEALTTDEKEDAKEAFDNMDVSGDGHVCESEARAFFEKRAKLDVENGKRTQEQAKTDVLHRIEDLFKMSPNHDKQVSFDEFLIHEAKIIVGHREAYNGHKLTHDVAAYMNQYEESCTEMSHEAMSVLTPDQIEHAQMKFSDWDTNSSGSLAIEELKHVAKELHIHMSGAKFKKVIKAAFKKFDADHDGSLSFEEFLPVYNFLYLQNLNFDDCV